MAVSAVATLGGLTFLLTSVLVIASRRLAVEEDPRIDAVEAMLPASNCGACGYPGCRAFAEALVGSQAQPAGCTVSDDAGRRRIADLLGVPRADHETFRGWLGGQHGNVGDPKGRHGGDSVFANLHPYFTRYIEERRAAPREDVLSQLALVRFPDGELPEVMDVVRIAAIVFAAGQETTARLLCAGMRILAEQPALADELWRNPGAIPNFVEECLRLEGPIKSTFRLALEGTRIGDLDVAAGTLVMGSVGAANRDPRVFQDPDRFDPKRRNARRHIAFGHGEHFCPGASLARAEARVSFERLLARLDDFRLVDPDALRYAETFIIRGLEALPLRFRPRP